MKIYDDMHNLFLITCYGIYNIENIEVIVDFRFRLP